MTVWVTSKQQKKKRLLHVIDSIPTLQFTLSPSKTEAKGGRPKCPYSVSTDQSFLSNMQLTNSATIVDFFPEAFVAEADDIKGMKVVIKRFIKRVYFRANGMKSYSTVVATDAKNEWASRIAKGAEVTDFNTDKMPSSEYMPMMC